VLGFKNLSAKPNEEWISTALAELLTSELAAGEQVRTIPGENVARMKLDLSLPDADGFSQDTLTRIRQRLGSDLVVLGSYVESGGQLRLDSHLQDTVAGETIASVTEQGTESELLDLVSRTGARLRERLGIGAVSVPESPSVYAAMPSNPEAARFYSEGLAKQRVFDNQAARDLFEKAVAADPGHALAHSALSAAWASLGYDAKSQEEAKKAFDVSAKLSREGRLSIEGRYRETTHEWSKAMEIYRTLWGFFPDSLDYGLRLVSTQASAGHAKDALVTIEALRKLSGPSGDDPRIDLAEASAGEWLGDYQREATAAARAAEKAKAQGARVLAARARLSEGGALGDLGETSKAIAALQESRQIYSEVGDQQGVARALNNLGIIQRRQGNFGDAKKFLQQSLEISRQTGNKLGVLQALNNLGNVLSDQGDMTKTQEAYEQSLKLTREIGDKGLEAISLDNIAGLLTTQGKLTSARQMYEESLRLAREIGDQAGVGRTLGNIADLQNRLGDLASARKTAEEALAIDRGIGDKSLSGYALSELGLILAAQGDLAAARSKQEEALALRQQIGEKVTAAESQLALAELLLEEGTPEKAESAARQVSAVFHEEVAVDDEAASRSLLARALLAQGNVPEAQQAVAQAEGLLAKAQDPATRLLVQITHARVTAVPNLKVVPSHTSIIGAKGNLNSALTEAKKFGYIVFQFEARLALGQIEMESGGATDGRTRLEALRKDATAQGFLLIARKAAAAAKASA
jgi:tetratricopeptide (TPR) repeat protein